jgi:hypothetical protein
MSADNWRVCPQCRAKLINDLDKAEQKLKKQYGKIEPDVFILSTQTLQNQREKMDETLGETLREDWSIGVDEDGLFVVGYRCSCSNCEFSYEYDFDKQLKLPLIKG